MKSDDFKKVLQNRMNQTWGVLALKAKEYASDSDRLHNFKRAAAMQNITPEKALIGMFAKHMVSILDMVDDLTIDRHSRMETWDEKLGDAVNYLILLEGLIAERHNVEYDRHIQNETHS
jgi:hypothetical protein